MPRSIVPHSLAAALCLLVACNSGNPVAPTEPGPNPTPNNITVTASANPSSITAGSTTPSLITVTAKKADNNPVDDGTEVSLTTSLGSFAQGGETLRTIKQLLNKGTVQVPLYAGPDTGTASVLAQVGTTVGGTSVSVAAAPAAVIADFTYSSDNLSVTFTDASSGNPTSWEWDFGDNGKSTEKNPTHRYDFAGTYTVSLKVQGAGGTNTRQKFVPLSTGTPVAASFDFEQDPNDPLKVQFFDRSTGNPTAWSWDFGDDTTSSARNPMKVYADNKTYTVKLSVSNAYSSGTVSRFVDTKSTAAPTADFDSQATGRHVQFVSKYTPSTATLFWDFGDKKGTSTESNPSYDYDTAGSYPVVLTVTSGGASATASKIVKTDPAPVANFSAEVSGVTVKFTDLSTNSPTSWHWSFGNGTVSTDPNPTVVYNRANHVYEVTLEATNAAGTGTITKQVQTGAASSATSSQ
jgi:PKD repeat protein